MPMSSGLLALRELVSQPSTLIPELSCSGLALARVANVPVVMTTYHLRSLGASNIEKATVAVKKETRGAKVPAGIGN